MGVYTYIQRYVYICMFMYIQYNIVYNKIHIHIYMQCIYYIYIYIYIYNILYICIVFTTEGLFEVAIERKLA